MFELVLDAILIIGSVAMGIHGLYRWINYKQRNSLVWCIAAVITLCSIILDFTAIPYLKSVGQTDHAIYLNNFTDLLIVASWAFAVYRDGLNRHQ